MFNLIHHLNKSSRLKDKSVLNSYETETRKVI